MIDTASLSIEPSCCEKAAGVHSEPCGLGVVVSMSGDCVMTLNTVFEHGVIVVTPPTDV